MLDIRLIRSEPEKVEQALRRRGKEISLKPVLDADARRRALLVEMEALKAKRNEASKEIGRKKKAGEDTDSSMEEMRKVGEQIGALEGKVREVETTLEQLLWNIPNLPDDSVPDGLKEEDNLLVGEWGSPRRFDFAPKPHWEVAANLGIVDFERATKIAGAKFEVFVGAGDRLRRALIQLMLDSHRGRGYVEVGLPLLARRDSLMASGHLPFFEEDQFSIRQEEMFLIPTAEAALANLHRDEILSADNLPMKYASYTPCFRYEKVGAGKESRGLIRQYQFDKVELFKFVLPETSFDELEGLRGDAEAIYQALEIPYRTVLLCAGEMGTASTKTYDPMAWFPGLDKWLELSSCSNCLDWQARRANVRFKRGPKGKPEFVHTLNGSGLAVGRTFAALLENHQQADGSVVIPEALRDYLDGIEKITAVR
ncbi:MAG: serine--tRNA ligase [Armatimonadetes bacterium]|nr:serine--tRNA ligase [Armatimonadota bacterium]NIM22753.1 serine--tRNA ligase [Armatimonadota bacterium]NIM66578.1 serine--tRNA ligase [Armatimonadota bacterium]NIM75179.1 serine--tRNA ligase [Armatimonadota bacterium]NIN04803.1 serine--tRNA ligase [Armatimonadota bacterium]